MTNVSRRTALMGAAALPLAAAASGPARASAPMLGVGTAPFSRVKLGAFEVTTILAGTRSVPDPNTIFGLNVTPEEFAAASAEANLPIDAAQFFFTPTVVNTGTELVLFDTGLAPEGTVAALASAGYTPDQVDKVVITHMHGDHIGGLAGDAGVTFPNAAYYTGAAEMNHWDMSGNEAFEAKVRPLQEKFTLLDDGGIVAGGITAMAAFGHTPGHMTYVLDSEDSQLVIIADLANHPVWSLARPDWEVRFDADKAAAAASRKTVLGMIAADRMPFIGYHMPFPAIGYVEAAGEGFRYVPHAYQLLL